MQVNDFAYYSVFLRQLNIVTMDLTMDRERTGRNVYFLQSKIQNTKHNAPKL